MKSGFVSIVGRPNVGKSTLINSLVGSKVAITSDKVGTTRNLIQGIYNDDESQIIFVDTPGIQKPLYKLGQRLNEKAYYSIDDVDIILFLVDVSEKFGNGDNFVLSKIKEANKPTFLLLNKIDKIKKEELIKLISEYKDLYSFSEIIPVSAIKGYNVSDIINTIKKYLPDSVKYFSDEEITNTSKEFRIAEIVREKVLRLTEKEVPHTVTCVTEEYNETKNKIVADVTIVVERDSVKAIIIGKGGLMLKEIGTKARIDIEKIFNKKVYLNLYVKTISKWRDKEIYLKELGFYNIDE